MSKAFEEISAGLDDAIKHAKGQKGKVVVHKPETINVQAIRKKRYESATILRNLRNITRNSTSLGAGASYTKSNG